MLISVHARIVRQALAARFSPHALRLILKANLGQDALSGQLGHDEYHFDNNAFEAGRAYIAQQRGLVFAALQQGEPPAAWAAFGRLTHAAQDFYAHSNYVDLWLRRADSAAPERIDPLDAALHASPELRSGKVYYPLDALYFVPGLRRLALAFLPRDSHGHMNLDSAASGPRFEYAFAAAVRRTEWEFEQVNTQLTEEARRRFSGGLERSGAQAANEIGPSAAPLICVLLVTRYSLLSPA
jgi:hypothetical protein